MINHRQISNISVAILMTVIILNITTAYAMTETRFVTIGDPQGDSSATKKAVDFINNIPNNVDFVVFLGDYINTATVGEIKKLNKPYYVVEGNHDVGKFNSYWGKNPSQYYSNVNGLQIVIPPFKWQNYNWGQVDKTIPAVVFSHAPMISNCGATDSPHKSGFDMKVETDKLNMLAAYAGHTHTWQKDIINGRLYVAEDSLSSGDRGNCKDGASKYVGYTTIKADGIVHYARIDFNKAFADPFSGNPPATPTPTPKPTPKPTSTPHHRHH